MPSEDDCDLSAENARLRRALSRERRARKHRIEINHLAAVTSGQVTRRGVAEVIAGGASDIFAAGWVMVGYVEDDEMVQVVHGPGVPDAIRVDWDLVPIDVPVPVCEVLRGTIEKCELSSREEFAPWPILAAEADRAQLSSFVVEPICGDGRPAAVIAIGWSTEHAMDESERALLDEFTEVAGPAFRRAIKTENDHDVASTLQSWLLPRSLPEVDGLSVSTIYESGKDELEVGGDWYDVVVIDDQRAAIVVGDVVGHNVRAAAEMGQIRHVLSSNLARSGDAIESLELTDRYFHLRDTDTMATALVMVFTAKTQTLDIASAGHLPPIVVEPGTAARTLDCGLGPPIGSGLGGYTSVRRTFDPQSVIVGFTDGLVERRDTPIDQCISDFCRLVDRVLSTSSGANAVDQLTDAVRARAKDSTGTDDAAAVIVRAH